MIKRMFDKETYAKIGNPNLTHKIYFNKGGIKRWGKVVLVNYHKEKK